MGVESYLTPAAHDGCETSHLVRQHTSLVMRHTVPIAHSPVATPCTVGVRPRSELVAPASGRGAGGGDETNHDITPHVHADPKDGRPVTSHKQPCTKLNSAGLPNESPRARSQDGSCCPDNHAALCRRHLGWWRVPCAAGCAFLTCVLFLGYTLRCCCSR